jgi:hypothetical protein
MKKLNYILTIIAMTSLFSCEPPVTFTEPQPADTDNLTKFPDRLQGRYVSSEGNSTLIVSDKLIQRIYDYDTKVNVKQLDSNYTVSGDTVTDIKTKEKRTLKREGDTLYDHVHSVDTLFQMSFDNVVRKFKGYYFLNTRQDKESWSVRKLDLSKGQLTISSISKKLDLDNLKAVTESPQDTTTQTNFKATKRQFKEFIKNDGFSDSETFTRTKKE